MPNRSYKKGLVILLNLLDAEAVGSQKLLFDMNERPAAKREAENVVMESIDRINRKLGRGTVFFGAEGVEKNWRQHRDYKSPGFTTVLEDLPIAR